MLWAVLCSWPGAVLSGIAAVVCFTWYAKSKNKSHLFWACCFTVAAIAAGAVFFLRQP
jgi:hypothetical protein